MRIGLDTFAEIGMALSGNRRRTILTGFGIFWGMFMLLFLHGVGQGLKQKLSADMDGFATNATLVASGVTSKPSKGFKSGREWSLKNSDVDVLRSAIPELDVISPVVGVWGKSAVHGQFEYTAGIKGVDEGYCKVEIPELKYGRTISATDVLMQRKVCVLGGEVYQTLFPGGGDPCGERVKIEAVYYTVIGVDMHSGNFNVNGPATRSVLIPISVIQNVYHYGDKVQLIAMTGRDGVKMGTLSDRIRATLGRAHYFDPADKQALFVMNTEEFFAMMDGLFKGLDFLLMLVGLGTILAGAIGVSNIMMVNVKARTVEIGIRRAIGATPADILVQNMLEGITIIGVAGILGIMFSVGMLSLVEKFSGSTAYQISFASAVGALVLLAVLGIVAGLAPAYRAMKIRPVDAMRDE